MTDKSERTTQILSAIDFNDNEQMAFLFYPSARDGKRTFGDIATILGMKHDDLVAIYRDNGLPIYFLPPEEELEKEHEAYERFLRNRRHT